MSDIEKNENGSWFSRFNFRGGTEPRPRRIQLATGYSSDGPFPKNKICNQKYSLITILPKFLYEQFQFFANLYFLLSALSQLIPAFTVGYAFAYWMPLAIVLSVSLIREAYDDIKRYKRDKVINQKLYTQLLPTGPKDIPSEKIQIGDLLLIEKESRIPADVVLLRSTERNGACFIRTDQLDGETDWKLRVALPVTQQLQTNEDLFNISAELYAEAPNKDIHSFRGNLKQSCQDQLVAIDIENTLWSGTVLATGSAIGLVVYTGKHTRLTMNTALPRHKVGMSDLEANGFMKFLFGITVVLSIMMTLPQIISASHFDFMYFAVFFVRYLILFSNIIPVSLRVNFDMAKLVYAWFISHDKQLRDVTVRNSTISEELGRISYLLSDKTGTLTKNEMIFKKLHLGTVAYGVDSFNEIYRLLQLPCTDESGNYARTLTLRTQEALYAIALCHNVVPYYEQSSDNTSVNSVASSISGQRGSSSEQCEMTVISGGDTKDSTICFSGSSPDEMSLVQWAHSLGVSLIHRDLHTMRLRLPDLEEKSYRVLQLFPFTSESKRMGIILQDLETSRITLYLKGADVVMSRKVQYNDWLDEESTNMAREGLRTLCVAQKHLTQMNYTAAKAAIEGRSNRVQSVIDGLEQDLQLLCITGVEDQLQDNVRQSIELLQSAGIRIWMLTGDKQETAVCISKNCGLFKRHHNIHVFTDPSDKEHALQQIDQCKSKSNLSVVISGAQLKTYVDLCEPELMSLLCSCESVVCCRCSPEQKAQLVNLVKETEYPKRVAAVGDGGNDVSMIQNAHAGIGIEAKEGKQASLAADFAINQFSQLCRLILVHGRYCYRTSAAVCMFVINRGMIISVIQVIFSIMFYFVSLPIYSGLITVGYTTAYTALPVLALLFDRDVKERVALMFPELYKDIAKGRLITYKVLSMWILISTFQGAVIIYGSGLLFKGQLYRISSISFSALIFTELLTMALIVHIWNWQMLVAEALSLAAYILSLFILPLLHVQGFDIIYEDPCAFAWKVAVITIVSNLPLYVAKFLRRQVAPPTYAKVK